MPVPAAQVENLLARGWVEPREHALGDGSRDLACAGAEWKTAQFRQILSEAFTAYTKVPPLGVLLITK
jgi:hypothetical protein